MTDTAKQTDHIDVPPLARDMPAKSMAIAAATETDPTRLQFALSSEAPVERFFGTEVLAHTAESIRMGRINDGAAPLLFNHDWSDPIGMVDSGKVKDGRLMVDAHLFDTERAKEVASMLKGGLRNVSIGYDIHAMQENKRGIYTATDWEPLEASIVTVPADASVGIGRDKDSKPRSVPVTRAHQPASAAQPKEPVMADENNTAAAEDATAPNQQAPKIEITREAQPRPNVAENEKRRKDSIRNLAKANRVDPETEHYWVTSGADLNTVADDLVKILEERSRAADVPALIGMEKREVRRYSVMRALRASASKDWSKAGLELEAHKTVMARDGRNPRGEGSFFIPLDVQMRDLPAQHGHRDMTAAGVSGSAFLVSQDNLAGSFIELLRNQSVVMGLGATRLSGLTGNVTIPRQTGASTAYWLANENTQITESQPTFGQITLMPKNVAALTEISHQLMSQSDPSAEMLVVNDLSRSLALAADVAALRGSGISGEPQGIVGTTGVGTFNVDSSETFADVISAQADVFQANALGAGCAYVADSAAAQLLMSRSRFSSTDTPIWDGNLYSGQMAGFPARASNQMEASTMLFGLWTSLILAEWGVLEVMVNPYSDFARGLASIRAWYTMDVALRYPAAFTYDSSVA